MLNLLKIELKKDINYKPFLVSLGLYLLLTMLFLSVAGKYKITVQGSSIGFTTIYNFPNAWHNLTYIASWFTPLLVIMVILLITNEYIFKTVRQNIIDGLNRRQYFFSKVLFIILLALFSTIFLAVFIIICNWIFAEDKGFSTDKTAFIPAFFMQTLGYLSAGLMFAFLIKRQGLAIILFLMYYFMIEGIIGYSLHDSQQVDTYIPNLISQYLPFKNFSGLIKNPFTGIFGVEIPESPETVYYMVSGIYTLVFLGITYYAFEKNSL